MKPLNLFPNYSWNLLSLPSFSTNNFFHELLNLIWSLLSLFFFSDLESKPRASHTRGEFCTLSYSYSLRVTLNQVTSPSAVTLRHKALHALEVIEAILKKYSMHSESRLNLDLSSTFYDLWAWVFISVCLSFLIYIMGTAIEAIWCCRASGCNIHRE